MPDQLVVNRAGSWLVLTKDTKKAKQYTNNTHKTLLQSYKMQIKIIAHPGLASSSSVFEEPGPAALLLGLARSTYYVSV